MKIKFHSKKEFCMDDALLSSIGEGVVALDEQGKVIKINQQATSMLNWEKNGDIVGKNWFKFASLENKQGELVPLDKRPLRLAFLNGQKIFTDYYYYVRKDGTKFPAMITAAPVIIGGKILAATSVFRDITKEKEIDRAKSEFISIAAHQLRTPLSALRWLPELILSGDLGPVPKKFRKFIQDIYDSTIRLINLVNILLLISRVEGQNLTIEAIPIDFLPTIKKIISEIEPIFLPKKLKITVQAQPGIPKVPLVPEFFREVILNLLSNAINYTKEKGRITIKLVLRDNQILFSVKDTGIGISEKDQSRIFEKFFRASNAKAMVTQGTGLGLYLVKILVSNWGGKIWFESRINAGTTFYLTIPIKE